MNPFVLNVRKTIQKFEMLQPGERVVVGVSGGGDSMALLHTLWDLRQDYHLSLAVAHLDHGLRPGSKEDLIFVQKTATHLGIPFIGRRVDLGEIQREKRLSLQEAAREVRYQFLRESAQAQKASKVALGHTADDQAESVLMRIVRGSGTRGLSGIPPVREGFFIRPLLEVWRKDVESFLEERKIAYLKDPSNRSRHFLRNRVRHELIPILRRYNPKIAPMMVQMADLFRAEEEFWQQILAERFPTVLRQQNKDCLTFDVPSLITQPFALRLRCYRMGSERILGNIRGFNFAHMVAVDHLVRSDEPNKIIQLPQGLSVAKAYHALIFSKSREEVGPFEYCVPGPGLVEIPEIGRGMRFEIQIGKLRRRLADGSSVALLDCDTLEFPLTIRSFRAGDRFQPLGMKGEKKVKDLFIDRKIPLPQRKRIPLLCQQGRLLWVAGLHIDHRARLKAETKRTLRVEFL